MKFFVSSFLLILAVFMFSGCEKDAENEYAELYAKIAKIKCEKEFECCQTSTKPRHYTTVDECVKYNEILSNDAVFYIPFSNYKWNKENADKCLKYWNNYSPYSSSCDEDIKQKEAQLTDEQKENIEELEYSCNSLLIGAAQLGDKCYPGVSQGDGCSEGLSCFKGTYTCEKTPSVGESCAKIDSCYTELDKEIYCDTEYVKDSEGNYETDISGNPVIKSAVCKYAPVIGEDCSEKTCDNNLENVFCEIIYKTDSEGNYEYDEETGSKIITSALCKELPKKGESCKLSKVCYQGDGIYCSTAGNDEGEAEYICREYPTAGMSCSQNYQCAEGLTCKYEKDSTYSYICREKSKEGSICTEISDCEDDLFCMIEEDAETGKCTKKYPGGQMCTSNNQCLSGECRTEDYENDYCIGASLTDQICIQYDYNDQYDY